MRKFQYFRDPAFLIGCAAYALNRWAAKPLIGGSFLSGHFNDFWLIPCALPPLLWLHRKMGWRSDDAPPRLIEIILHLAAWSLLFEAVGPLLVKHATGDLWDIAAYWLGGSGAWCFWNWQSAPSHAIASGQSCSLLE